MARFTAALAMVLALVGACASAAAVPYPGVPTIPSSPARAGTVAQPSGPPPMLSAPGVYTPMPVGSSPHNAFPTAAHLPDGTAQM